MHYAFNKEMTALPIASFSCAFFRHSLWTFYFLLGASLKYFYRYFNCELASQHWSASRITRERWKEPTVVGRKKADDLTWEDLGNCLKSLRRINLIRIRFFRRSFVSFRFPRCVNFDDSWLVFILLLISLSKACVSASSKTRRCSKIFHTFSKKTKYII